MTTKGLARAVPIAVALGVGCLVAMWPALEFEDLGGSEFASRFGVVVFFSLLIERTVEILMTIWRSEEANKREAAVQRLVADGVPATDPKYIAAHDQLVVYKAETLQWTMPVGFALGLLVSAFGVRALSQFLTLSAEGGTRPGASQLWWFNVTDIVFTGALLAGGADPVHKVLDLYRKFMESSAAKAAGTRH